MPPKSAQVNGDAHALRRELSAKRCVVPFMEAAYFFNGWDPILRIAIVSVCGYVGAVLLLRITGKRTLSQMNVFDLVVTIALGSTLASLILSKSTALAEGLTAFALLIAMQYVIAWSTSRSRWVMKIVKAEPALLLSRGEMLRQTMRRERVAESEVVAAVRQAGILDMRDVRAVVLETDGTFTVIPETREDPGLSTLFNVRTGSLPFQ